MTDILKRIERQVGVDNLVDVLSERLDTSDLNSLLMEVARRRAQKRTPAALLDDYRSNRFVKPSTVDPAVTLAWDQIAFASLPPGFEAIELSPVCPLGTSSVVATVNQDKVVTTTRGLEVMSDATNALALECALRRRNHGSASPVHLAASHRVVRPSLTANPLFTPHFRLFALCSAGRDTQSSRLRDSALAGHVGAHVRALTAFLGSTAKLRIAVTVLEEGARPAVSTVVDGFRGTHEGVEVDFDDSRTTGRGYYKEVCFKIYCHTADGPQEIGDGGLVDWGAKLLSNAKERMFISGIGSERVCGLL